jgi:hypothetical protein
MMWGGIDDCPCGLAPEDRGGHAYNEPAFRHFLAIERKRAARANRSCLLLLVGLRRHADPALRVDAASASRLFAALAVCVREVDFIGWYRQERIAGAVLIQGMEAPESSAISSVGERISHALRQHLSSSEAERLRIRVLPLCRRSRPWVQ